MYNRPKNNEYVDYYQPYLDLVPDGELLSILESQLNETVDLLKNTTEEQANYRYAEGKWSLKEVVGHVADTERVMAYRLLCIGRGETAGLPGFDENFYVASAKFERQTLPEILENFEAVRRSTLHLLKGLDGNDLNKKGNANNSVISALAIACIIAGHEFHHRQIIKERYL